MIPDPSVPALRQESLAAEGGAVSLFALLNVLLRQRRLMLAIPLALGVLAVGLGVLRGSQYTAQARFMPQTSQRGTPRFATVLAAQLGFTIDGATRGESPEFYAELVKSRELLRELALTRYRFPVGREGADSLGGTVIELYRIEGRTPEERERAGIDVLSKQVSASVGLRTGLVTLRTTARWPALAVQLNRRLLDLLNAYNLEKRQSQAGAERRFVEERMRQAQTEVEAAEAELERFLRRNRSFQGTPELAFEAARLERRVALRQQVYTSLAQAYEEARVDEVRDIPVITVVDRPEGSARRLGSPLILHLALALGLGAVLAVMLAFAREYLARQRREDPQSYHEFAVLGRAAVGRLGARLPGARRHAAD